jgi:hypothetical protein
VEGNASSLGDAGFTNRLLGYVGEQQAADALVAQGHTVTMAASANNPRWDLLIDGRAANVKTYRDSADAWDAVHSDSETLFIFPEDSAGRLDADNAIYLDGFSYSDATAGLSDSLNAGHTLVSGDYLADALFAGVPVTFVAFATYRQVRAVNEGKRLGAAAADLGLDLVVRGTGLVIGAKAGAVLGAQVDLAFAGSTFGAGALVGGMVGAAAGSTAGAAAINWWKYRPVRSAQGDLKRALAAYGEGFLTDDKLTQLEDMILAPVRRSEDAVADLDSAHTADVRTLRWWLWPGAGQVLREVALEVGRRELEAAYDAAEDLRALWQRTIADPNAEELIGLAMANAPNVASRLGGDEYLLTEIELAQLRAQRALARARR